MGCCYGSGYGSLCDRISLADYLFQSLLNDPSSKKIEFEGIFKIVHILASFFLSLTSLYTENSYGVVFVGNPGY
jgi:hypothetical protein